MGSCQSKDPFVQSLSTPMTPKGEKLPERKVVDTSNDTSTKIFESSDSKGNKHLLYTESTTVSTTASTTATVSTENNVDTSSEDDNEHRGHAMHRKASDTLTEIIETRNEGGGELTANVVHIELPLGKPIEEVYDGVHAGEILGSGVSGLVRRVTHMATGIEYAVKCLDLGLLNTEEGLEYLRQEIFIMCQLDHPNILRLEEVYQSSSEIYLVQELCHGGELFDRLDEQPDYHYSEQRCARLVYQMLYALRYLHSKKVIHRDLKLENFLFSSTSENSELKMIDFGLSKHFKYGEELHEAVGTPYTVAPEVIRGSYDEKCDLWAIGVITFLLLSGDSPFGGCGGPESLATVRSNILQGLFYFDPPEIWDNVSVEAKDFISSLLVTDPSKRPSAQKAQNSPWLQKWAAEETNSCKRNGNKLSPDVVTALLSFREYSDMRKLLCEVLSFTLIPEQIQDLREEFEKIDTDGSGEISLSSLETVLMESADSGSLGALKKEEVEDIFNAMRVRKTETKIHWHEFIAASLSQCKVDDRNLRLAFDRLDKDHKGYINVEDILQIIGSNNGSDADIYKENISAGLSNVQSNEQHISYEDFIMLMKGQTASAVPEGVASLRNSIKKTHSEKMNTVPELNTLPLQEEEVSIHLENTDIVNTEKSNITTAGGSAGGYINLPEHEHDNEAIDTLINDNSRTALVVNRALYRAHRQMRLGVLEACKRFEEFQLHELEEEQKKLLHESGTMQLTGAGLIMRRGHSEKLSTEGVKEILKKRQKEQQVLLEKASKLAGRGKRSRRKKTVSDMTMLMGMNPAPRVSRGSSSGSQSSENSPIQSLKVTQSSAYFMRADSRSCPPSPALETGQNSPLISSVVTKAFPSLPPLTVE